MTDRPTVVWTEIPVTDLDKAEVFYRAVFAFEMRRNSTGPNEMIDFTSAQQISGHLYPGKPASAGSGPTIHLALPGTLVDGMERCTAAGGTVVSPIVTIPQGRFAYALDPDGNSIGLFEPA